jgi:precorrin-6B methylase 2
MYLSLQLRMKTLEEISTSCQIDKTAFTVSGSVASKDVHTTYGEITPTGVSTIIDKLKINSRDVFYDLGSGTGRVCLQMYLDTRAKCVGIESVPSRHDIAMQSANKLRTNKLCFYKGNFMTRDWSDATVVYICNTCFSDELHERIVTKLRKTCKKLRALVCMKAIESEWLQLVSTIPTPTSWSSSSTCAVYAPLYIRPSRSVP